MYGVTRNAKGFECYPVGQRDLFVILRQDCDMFRSVFRLFLLRIQISCPVADLRTQNLSR